ncbi:hypothetical protein NHX12_019671 [Muraenolepis orangiensis]|uniref:ZP domain-containing protein n=1 Tax=Muraenolepis orangiensis TaxID=630683 RepID=A0A9Q0IU49_9TELE|nr:hypothetical protein NHX12_019671 [Muraenolepis orangiensis]
MAKGEGAEQYSATSLLPVKPLSADGIKIAQQKKERRKPLSICSKLCYAVGGAPYQITGSALGFFLQIYLLDVAQLDPFYASIILFVGRAWDAVTDPTVGFLVSRTKWTRFGRMTPWVLLSTPFAVTCYFLIWYVPEVEQGKVLWYLVWYCLFQSLQTCFHVPYSSLTMFISSEQKERDSATAYRMTMEVLGSVVGTAIQGQIVGGAVAPCIPTEYDLDHYGNASRPERNITRSLDETKEAYMIASGVICAIYALCAIVLFVGVKEQEESGQTKSKPITFCQGLRLVMGHGPYIKLVLGFLFTSLAFMLLEGNFALFLTYALDHRDDFQNILLLSGTVSIPFWQWFLTRYGKKTAVYFGITWAVPFMILIVCIKSNLLISYMVSVAAGISVAAAYLLPWSMLPDVVDDFKVKNPDIRGYEPRLCRVLVSPVPVALIALGLLIFKTYPIDEERRQNNRKLLQELLSQPDFVYLPDVSVTCSTSDFVVRVKTAFYGFGANADELRLGSTCKSNGVLGPYGDLLFTFRITECEVQRTWNMPAKSQIYLLGQTVNLQVSASHLPPGGKVYISSCFATPYNVSESPLKYPLVDNFGCLLVSRKDPGGSWFVSSRDRQTLRFSLSAFQFTSDPDTQVQIQCKLHVTSEGPSAVYKACTYDDDGWRALYGEDHICDCCESQCTASKSKRAMMEGSATSGPILVSSQPPSSEDHSPSATPPLISTTSEGELEDISALEAKMYQPITEQGSPRNNFSKARAKDDQHSAKDAEVEKELEGDGSVWVEGVNAIGRLDKLGFGSGLITREWEEEMSGMGDLDDGGLQHRVTEDLLETEEKDESGSMDSSETTETVQEDEAHGVSIERLELSLLGKEEVESPVTVAQREAPASGEMGTRHWAEEGGKGPHTQDGREEGGGRSKEVEGTKFEVKGENDKVRHRDGTVETDTVGDQGMTWYFTWR